MNANKAKIRDPRNTPDIQYLDLTIVTVYACKHVIEISQ